MSDPPGVPRAPGGAEARGVPAAPAPTRPDPGGTWPWATWSLHETVAVVLAPFGLTLVASIALVAFGAEGSVWVFVLTVVQQAALGLGIWAWVRAHTGSTAGLGLVRGGWTARDLGAGIAAGFGAVVATSITIVITMQLTGVEEVSNPLEEVGDAWVVPTALVALLMAPVCEEIAFRGFLYGGLRRRWRPAAAALCTALPFAMIHGDPVRLPGLAVAGMILAAVYERRRTLVAAMAAHGVVNAIAVIGTLAAAR
jgi:hypothetical protein